MQRCGPNEITHEKPPTWYSLLFRNIKNPFNLLLGALGIVSFFLEQYDAVVIIFFMVLLSVGMRFIQEYRSNLAAEKLKAMVSTKATVLRLSHVRADPLKYDINIRELVPGDIIHLSAGDMVPADVRLIYTKELFVSQAALTGETLPVEKSDTLKGKDNMTNPLEASNLCFLGTNVSNGTAIAVIINTGDRTYFGSMAKSIIGYRPLTSFDIGVNKISWLLIKIIFIMVPIVFLLNGLTKGIWFDAFLFSLSVAIGLTPEMLPMIVTANLSRGAVNMSRSKVVVKHLNSIQNFGAMDILCTDKTGTLTQDRIILEKHLNADGEDCDDVLKFGYLNSYYQTGLKNLLDIAVLQHTEINKQLRLDCTFPKRDEIPFDFNRRRMSVVVEKDPQRYLLICKGAVEETLSICDKAQVGDSEVPLTQEIKTKLDALQNELNEDGLRVLAVAYKEMPAEDNREYVVRDESGLVFMGYLAFLDPPKLSAAEAIANLKKAHVQVKVITGDNERVTKKICKWVELPIEGVLLGSDIDKMTDEELKKHADKTTIFAKVAPLQKSRIIAALKSNGHTVGFLGDGINDAPALREADIGISVDTAVDIAKESADIIMLEKSLLFLEQGVIEGRKTFGNIIKYLKMAVSSNFGNVFSVLGSSIILPFLPMTSLQLLVQNLLYDLSQTTIPFDNVDEEFLRKPRKWDPGGILKFMFFVGPISSIFDYATFAVMWFYFLANTPERQSLFQSGWFIEGLLSQTLIVHMIRTQKIPFFQSMASFPLMLTTIIVMAIGIYIPYSYISPTLEMQGLPGTYFYWLLGILISYCLLTQIVKIWFIRRFNYWL